jgi:hypothetical protein
MRMPDGLTPGSESPEWRQKLNLHNTAEIVLYAVRKGLVV